MRTVHTRPRPHHVPNPSRTVSTPGFLRRTTRDTRAAKVVRVKQALLSPETAAKSNREVARVVQVDEAMVRRWRLWANQFVPQPGLERPTGPVPDRPATPEELAAAYGRESAPPAKPKKNAGTKRPGAAKRRSA